MTDQQRYLDAAHAMQSGVAAKMNIDGTETRPKDLRVGVNSAMVETSALVYLLIQKHIITEGEWFEALANMMEQEVKSYEDFLTNHYGTGTKISLG